MNASCTRVWPLVLCTFVVAFAQHGAYAREGTTATRKLADDVFLAGGEVRLTEAVAGDAVLAGGRIAASGTVHGDEVAAGGQLDLGGAVDGGLYAAGGRVHLDNKVARNARVAGGEVELGPRAEVLGGLTIGGGRVEVDGRVGKYLQVGAGKARIDGYVGGDVDVASEELVVGPDAVIDGVLTYYGPQPATVADAAKVKGGIRFIEQEHWGHRGHSGALHGFGIGAWLWLAGWMLVGSILLWLWPVFVRSVTQTALGRPWIALLTGFVVLVCVPVAAVLLAVTVIGIPLALLLVCLYLALLPLGYLASAAALADGLLSRLRATGEIVVRERILMLLGVLLALFVLTRIPVLGGIVRFLVLLAGIGSLVMVAVARHRAA